MSNKCVVRGIMYRYIEFVYTRSHRVCARRCLAARSSSAVRDAPIPHAMGGKRPSAAKARTPTRETATRRLGVTSPPGKTPPPLTTTTHGTRSTPATSRPRRDDSEAVPSNRDAGRRGTGDDARGRSDARVDRAGQSPGVREDSDPRDIDDSTSDSTRAAGRGDVDVNDVETARGGDGTRPRATRPVKKGPLEIDTIETLTEPERRRIMSRWHARNRSLQQRVADLSHQFPTSNIICFFTKPFHALRKRGKWCVSSRSECV